MAYKVSEVIAAIRAAGIPSKESDMALTHRELCQIAYKSLSATGSRFAFMTALLL